MAPDEFSPDIYAAHWLFTVALGGGLGLCLAAAVVAAMRLPGWKASAAVLVVGGFLLSAFVGTLAVDAAPWAGIDVQLKPYLTTVAETAAMVGALGVGSGVVAAGALLLAAVARRLGRSTLVAAIGSVLFACVLLAVYLPVVGRAAGGPEHPPGTDTSRALGSVPVLEGLDVPTGLDIADNGDMLVVELPGRRVVVASPDGERAYAITFETSLELADDNFAFHGAFHPEYPAVPITYVVTQVGPAEERTLQVLEVTLTGAGSVRPVITGLPTTQRDSSNHHGAGIAVCGGYLFVSTSDGDSLRGQAHPGTVRWDERVRAQLPNSGFGQIMRWRIEGTTIIPDGEFGTEFPSFAMGLRNPFGINCDAATGWPLVADNGERGFDQVRLAEPGSNHGWPLAHDRTQVVRPWFDTGESTIAPTGIAQRPDNPEAVLITGFESQALYEIVVDRAAQETDSVRLLAEVDGGAYAVAIGPDGCVYYTDVSAVYRLSEPGCD